jgi:acetyl-CoA carboxylase biotin carboxylase subunit
MAAGFATEDYLLVKKGSKSPYLDMEQIISIAKIAGADAIHPGYGFLSENADFAKMCIENGIVFIGPSPQVIRKAGNKIEAKRFVSDLGIATIPGYSKPIMSIDQIKAIASEFGLPLMLKAAEGGGGRGIRIVKVIEDLESAFQSVKREALAAFESTAIYVEKHIEKPRHIEFQIVADGSGNVVHLGERECSIQRRHQKLVEEAPSTALSTELRDKMGAAAVSIARGLGYKGIGSVEFLLKGTDFYFMEINPRLQVEHGITEKITGVDIVKEQIRIAYGSSLSYGQEDIKSRGWAIEFRINAESAIHNFKPSWGIITKYIQPIASGISISSAVREFSDVSPHYDSMIAKLIAHGSDRKEAIGRAIDALGAFVVSGIDTTIPLHKEILRHPAFIEGDTSTSFLSEHNVIEKLKLRNRRLIIAAAVSHYLRSRLSIPENTADRWVSAARLEAMNSGVERW